LKDEEFKELIDIGVETSEMELRFYLSEEYAQEISKAKAALFRTGVCINESEPRSEIGPG
jgi:hypothetical protein